MRKALKQWGLRQIPSGYHCRTQLHTQTSRVTTPASPAFLAAHCCSYARSLMPLRAIFRAMGWTSRCRTSKNKSDVLINYLTML
jgi:hypothetical protein